MTMADHMLTDKEKRDGEADLSRKHFDICQEVSAERIRQNKKFCKSPIGVQHHNLFTWIAILGEEAGECCKAAIDWWFGGTGRVLHGQPFLTELRTELIQVAAVVFAIIERIDARDPALIDHEGTYVNTLRP